MRGPRLIQFWRPLSQRYEEKNGKALNSVRRAENGNSDALNLRSVKNSKS